MTYVFTWLLWPLSGEQQQNCKISQIETSSNNLRKWVWAVEMINSTLILDTVLNKCQWNLPILMGCDKKRGVKKDSQIWTWVAIRLKLPYTDIETIGWADLVRGENKTSILDLAGVRYILEFQTELSKR